MRLFLLSLLLISPASAIIVMPFTSWEDLTEKTPDIIIARCTTTPEPRIIADHMITTEIEVLAVLKGETQTGPAKMVASHWPRQGECFLLFSHYMKQAQGMMYTAAETYRAVPLGLMFSPDHVKGQPLQTQIQTLLRHRLTQLNQEETSRAEEIRRLEKGVHFPKPGGRRSDLPSGGRVMGYRIFTPEEASVIPYKPAAATRLSQIEFPHLTFDAKCPPAGIKHQGNIVKGARWHDLNGDNVLILAQTGVIHDEDQGVRNAELYAYHYLLKDGAATQLWNLVDFVHDCGLDLDLQFVDHSFAITDLDQDGIAESHFAYRQSCHGDVSPAALKFILHEGKDKYAIRGIEYMPIYKDGGQMTADPAFDKAPGPFKTYAITKWRRLAGLKSP